jgi:hypothetical protein
MESGAKTAGLPRKRVNNKLTLWVGSDTKRRVFILASARDMTVSELFEYLIVHADEISRREILR